MADGRHGAGRAGRARRAAVADRLRFAVDEGGSAPKPPLKAPAVVALAFFAVTSVTGLASCFARGPNGPEEARSRAEQDLATDALRNGRTREAYDHVQRALKINPDNAGATYLGAMVLLQLCALDESSPDCRLKEAETFARRTLEIDADQRDAKNALGVILVHEHRYDDAIAVLKPLTEDLVYNSPENAWGNLGWAYFERGSTAEAIDALSRAVAVQPLFCVGRYRLGLAYEKRGDLPLARDALTKAVDTDAPQCKRLQDAYSARARILQRQGLRDDARADLERCRDIGAQTPTGQRCTALLNNGGDPHAPGPGSYDGGRPPIPPGPAGQPYQ